MAKTIRIGGACAFYGDSSVAPTQLIAAGVDYIILDYLAEATMSVLGNIAPFRARRIEILGAEASYGANARAQATREVICKVGVEHDDPKAFKYFLREFDSPTTSMAVGTAGWFGGRSQVTPVMRVFSCLIERDTVPVTVTLGATEVIATPAPPIAFDPAMIVRPTCNEPIAPEMPTRTVPLIELAWARSGDKGDAFNIGVIARQPEYLPYIRAALT